MRDMESLSSYYQAEAYFPSSRKYLEPRPWLSCDEQQRLLQYHYSQNKRGLSYASRSTPLQDLTRLSQTPEHHEANSRYTKKGIQEEIPYDERSYYYSSPGENLEWISLRQPVYPNETLSHRDINQSFNQNGSFRSKSKERRKKTLGYFEHSVTENGNDYHDYEVRHYDNERHYDPRDITPAMISKPPNSHFYSPHRYDVQYDPVHCEPSPKVHSNVWHPWPDVARSYDRSSAMSPSSPLDSGLSSQSVASTTSSEIEPLFNSEHISAENYEWYPTSHTDCQNVGSCQSEICTCSVQTDRPINRNCQHSPERTLYHSSQRKCPNGPVYKSVRERRQHATNSFQEEVTSDITRVQCKCCSSVESMTDTCDHKNGSCISYPEKVEYCNNRKSCNSHSKRKLKVQPSGIPSSNSDETSESTLKASPVRFSSPLQKSSDECDSTYKTDSDDHHQRTDSDDHHQRTDTDLEWYQKQRIIRTKKAEKALRELEEIYNQLNLDDYDLLDRAERRDLPTAHQEMAERNSVKSQPLTRSKSDTFYEVYGRKNDTMFSKKPRAPPLRRSGIPDRIADDMALRKQQKPFTKFEKNSCSPSSYLLYSTHFTPTISPVVNEFPFANKPDVEYDDFSYRKFFQPKAYHDHPQPPFGIPVHPIVQCPNSNYLHVTPSSVPRPLCHARGNPDVVRDDMAFRNLRKDNP